MYAGVETLLVKIVFQENPICKGFINIKTSSNNKLHVLSLSGFNPLFQQHYHYRPTAFGHGENTSSTMKRHLELRVFWTVGGTRLS